MDKAEFDRFAQEYHQILGGSIRASGEGPEFFAAYKADDVREAWDQRAPGREPVEILDFGGGVGGLAPHLRRRFPATRLTIADVSEKSLEIAAARGVEGLVCLPFDGVRLPLADASVDLALASCVFHHITHDDHGGLLADLRRVLRPGGMLMVFEHNPWNPLTVRAVNTCPFDENAVLITAPEMRRRLAAAGFSTPPLRYRIFFPGPLRALRPLEAAMTWLPLGAQYVATGVR